MSTERNDDDGPTEVVGLFGSREGVERAIAGLKAAGFADADLSLLASHESIEAADKSGRTWKQRLVALVDELRYEQPLVASGAIFLAGGPVAATIAAVIGAAVGGIAVKEVLEEVTATPHTDQFARSIEAGGVILWVRAEAAEREEVAARVLSESGGTNVHSHRPQAAV